MYKKILVINLMHIGDLMLVTPALRTLRKNYPQAQISMLIDKKLADLMQWNKNIDECILLDKKGADNHLISFAKFMMKIRAKEYDLVINLHRNERASAIAALSGAKKIVGYSKPIFAKMFDKVMNNPSIAQLRPKYIPGSQHQVKSHLDVLREALGIEDIDDRGLELWIPEQIEEESTQIFNDHFKADDRVIAFNIGASWLTKRWIDSYFADCADRLIEKNFAIAFLGGPSDIEIVNSCIDKMKYKDSQKVKVFTGKLTLAQVAGILDNCILFLTTDSGPMHIGVARNIPIVTMFGASPVPGFYPYDSKDILIRSPEPCQPCGQHQCPRSGDENLACMKKISVEVVMNYINELIDEYGQKAKYIERVYGNYQCKVIEL